jgi:hypothetical protein
MALRRRAQEGREDMRICSMLVGMKWAGGTAGPRPGAGMSRAMVRIAISALWLAAGVDEGAAATDGVAPIGSYTAMRYSDEHCDGYAIDLWGNAETVQGLLHVCHGLADSQAVGLIEQVSYDEKTGHLAFTARLTVGSDYVRGGDQVPSRDVFTFDGHLATTEITGTLKHVDQVYAKRVATSEQIRLKKQREKLSSYPTLADWRRKMDENLETTGPKW